VKRISSKQKLKRLSRDRRRYRANCSRPSSSTNSGLRLHARNKFVALAQRLPTVPNAVDKYLGYFSFNPPKVFSFSENYEDTFAFLLEFQRQFQNRKRIKCVDGILRRAYADFALIDRIDAGAGLVLAAEIHRFSQTRGHPTEVHDHLWSQQVSDFFSDAGLFDLLNIDPRQIQHKICTEDQRQTLKFAYGRTSKGQDVKSLIGGLRNLAGQPLGSGPTVYAAIAEALANVRHAYPEWFRTWPYRTSKQWWASGFWNPTSKTVGVQLYDQGAGIPQTLPKQTYWPKLLKFLDPESSPSGLIAAALEYGRTSSGVGGRGKGLGEMADWIESTNSGFLRILSGGGELTYRPGGNLKRRNFNAPFFGTLVEWEVTIGTSSS
jgi:hypothetical protein